MILRPLAAVLVLMLPALAACGGDRPGPGSSGDAPPASPVVGAASRPAPMLAADLPGAVPVLAALAGKEGEEVAVVGRVQSKVKGRALFHLVDDSVEDCTRTGEDDHCRTPWDYCCEDRDSMKRNMATIEIAGDDGAPLALPLRGLQGLDPLATVSVTGTVTERNDQGVLVVRAKRIAVQ